MRVTVKLFATFRLGRFLAETREYPPGTTVGSILEELELPERELGAVFVNYRHADKDYELREGDIVSIFPLVGGG
ncbi:MAG TPA: MoaD/ThiS family protein [Geobacteraceae bacterium]|nr:MoaD/ThiS family protein [Geobacteraceae bacterium]